MSPARARGADRPRPPPTASAPSRPACQAGARRGDRRRASRSRPRIGSSRAGVDVRDAGRVRGASASASSRARCSVREYRCGWKRTSTRPVPGERARGRERRRDLRRVVGVVVDRRRTPPASPRARAGGRRRGTRRARAQRLLARDARELERRERAGGVQAVVLTGNGELELERARARRRGRPARRGPLGEPAVEELFDLRPRAERRVVVEVDVRDDRDLGPEREHRAVRLVPLDDEPAAPRRVRCLRAAGPRRRSGTTGRARAGRGTNAIIAAVVVLPCAPETTIERRERASSARSSARVLPVDLRGEGGRDDGLAVRRAGGRLGPDLDLDPCRAHDVPGTGSRTGPSRPPRRPMRCAMTA